VALGPLLDVFAEPNPADRELGKRLREIVHCVDDLASALARHTQKVRYLGNADELVSHNVLNLGHNVAKSQLCSSVTN
jgi:hypothetical protein